MKLALILPDAHIPYHNKRALDIALQVGKDLGSALAEIVILGDFGDFYAVNGHGKHSQLHHTLEKEVEQIRQILAQITAEFPEQKKVYLEGNHEYRLSSYLHRNAPALFGVTQWDILLGLDKLPGWKAIDYSFQQYHRVLGTELFARHEPYSMSSASSSLSRCAANLVYGHVHRREMAITIKPDGKEVVNFSPGWLGNIDKRDVFGYVKNRPKWELGFAIVSAEEGRARNFTYELVKFHNEGKLCRYNGKTYK